MVASAKILPPRQARLVIGPPGGVGIAFEQEYFTAKVRSYKGRKPNEATAAIHNLSETTIAALEKPGLTLQVLAGEGALGQLFIGQITSRGVVTKNDSPNRVTTIKAKDGRRIYRDTKLSTSYPPGVAVAGGARAGCPRDPRRDPVPGPATGHWP